MGIKNKYGVERLTTRRLQGGLREGCRLPPARDAPRGHHARLAPPPAQAALLCATSPAPSVPSSKNGLWVWYSEEGEGEKSSRMEVRPTARGGGL